MDIINRFGLICDACSGIFNMLSPKRHRFASVNAAADKRASACFTVPGMSATKTLRSLLQELRSASPNGCIKNSLAARYILAQYKKFSTTDQQLCKARGEALFLGQTYLTYLSSLRKYNELYKEYHGRGERTVRQTADLVGFKLPTDPK